MKLVAMTKVPLPMVPIDEDGVRSTGVGDEVGDEVGSTLNIKLIVPQAPCSSQMFPPMKMTLAVVAVNMPLSGISSDLNGCAGCAVVFPRLLRAEGRVLESVKVLEWQQVAGSKLAGCVKNGTSQKLALNYGSRAELRRRSPTRMPDRDDDGRGSSGSFDTNEYYECIYYSR